MNSDYIKGLLVCFYFWKKWDWMCGIDEREKWEYDGNGMKKKKKKKWLQEGKFFLDRSRGWIVSSFVCFWLENVTFSEFGKNKYQPMDTNHILQSAAHQLMVHASC